MQLLSYLQALIERHTASLRLGDSRALKADSEALVRITDRSDDLQKIADACYRELLYINFTGNAQAIAVAAQRAIAAAQHANNQALEARGLQFQMLAQIRLGEIEAAFHTTGTALACAKQSGDDNVLANVLSTIAVVYDEANEPQKAVEYNTQALAIAQRAEARVLEARILVSLGNGYRGLGLYDLAQSTLERAIKVNYSIGARRERAYVLSNLGLVQVSQAKPNIAHPLLEEALAESKAIGDEYLKASCLQSLGYVAEQLKDLTLAITYFDQARINFDKLSLFDLVMESTAGLARLALVQGELQSAQRHADQLWQYLNQHGMSKLVLETHLACADVFMATGNLTDGRAAIEAGYRELIDRAYKISNAEWRKSFLENVPENRQLLEYSQKYN